MMPHLFDYVPNAEQFLQKVAEDAGHKPAVHPPQEPPPPHPYKVGLKMLVPTGVGLATGLAAGLGIPAALHKAKIISSKPNYPMLGAISTVSGGIAGLAATLLAQAQKAEMERANEEYKNYRAQRAGPGGNPSVQPPQVRS